MGKAGGLSRSLQLFLKKSVLMMGNRLMTIGSTI